jgi:hypothetical protein
MLGALGAVTATTPSEWLLAWIGWRGLFEWHHFLVEGLELRSALLSCADGFGPLRARL